jgi:hypothetical protein
VHAKHTVYLCILWFSEKGAIISIISVNWLVIVMDTQYVFCEVETEFFSIIQMNFIVRVESKCLDTQSLFHDEIINKKKWGEYKDKIQLIMSSSDLESR